MPFPARQRRRRRRHAEEKDDDKEEEEEEEQSKAVVDNGCEAIPATGREWAIAVNGRAVSATGMRALFNVVLSANNLADIAYEPALFGEASSSFAQPTGRRRRGGRRKRQRSSSLCITLTAARSHARTGQDSAIRENGRSVPFREESARRRSRARTTAYSRW